MHKTNSAKCVQLFNSSFWDALDILDDVLIFVPTLFLPKKDCRMSTFHTMFLITMLLIVVRQSLCNLIAKCL